jgi:hypothetical protein
MSDGRGRHRFDPGALIGGLFFLGVAVAYLLRVSGDSLRVAEEVLLPVTLGGLPVVVLIRLITLSRQRRRR